ncbi:MAG: tRNA (guanosine(46)-N7)-methyltransferase TrmB [Ignavibacterium sp.]
MPRRKLFKKNEVVKLPNVFIGNPEEIKNKIKDYFKNYRFITLELGCGFGEYSVNLAQLFPEKYFVGIDRKGNRIYNGAKESLQLNLNNIAFLIYNIDQIENLFEEDMIEEIWLPFPEPNPRNNNSKKRITHPRFLEIYKKLLINGGKVHLKTDDEFIFNYTLKMIKEHNLILFERFDDIYSSINDRDELKILTKYEKLHLQNNKKIKYLSFGFDKGK